MSTPSSSAILSELAKAGYNIEKVACTLQAPYSEVERLAREATAKPPSPQPARLAPYLVSAKRTDQMWPPKDREAIVQARRLYNEGTHELVQNSQEGWTWLFSVPRKEPVGYRKYFDVER